MRDPPRRVADADLVIKTPRLVFVVEYKGAGESASVLHAVDQAKRYAAALARGAVPMVAVSFMGEAGRNICERAGISWMDLSGNASIVAPGTRILVEGKPNRFKRRGRPATVFAPKSSRVVRQLLMDPTQRFSQRQLATATRLDEGFVSRIVHRLQNDGHLDREPSGSIKVANPSILLDNWRTAYDFARHDVLRGHIAARSADEVIQRIHTFLAKRGIDHALTGLAAAWALTGFAAFRLVTVYWREPVSAEDLDEIGFRDDERGANLWLVLPNDDGVFDGCRTLGSVPCVNPVQVYLDLKAQPERSFDAAAELRQRCLAFAA